MNPMNTDAEFLKTLVNGVNESYVAGFEQGILEGKRQAYAEFQKIIAETFREKEAVQS